MVKMWDLFPKLVPYSIEFDVLLYEIALTRRRRKFWRFGRCKIAERQFGWIEFDSAWKAQYVPKIEFSAKTILS